MPEGAIDSADEQVLAELAAVHTTLDPVPDGLVDDVKFAITVQMLHAEVAELVATPALAVRDELTDPSDTTDTITFTSEDVSLMIAVERTHEASLTVDGWVTIGGARIEVHNDDDTLTVEADEHGRFVLTGLRPGRTWFVVRRHADDEQPPVVTPPMEL